MASWIERRQAQNAGSGFIILDSYGGRINEIAPDATAFVHRDALYSCQFGAYWSGSGQSAALSWISSPRVAATLRAIRFQPWVEFSYQ